MINPPPMESNTLAEEFNLAELCDNEPEKANHLIKSGGMQLARIKPTGIPWVIFISRALCTTDINRLVSVRGSVIRTGEVLFKNVLSEHICLGCNASIQENAPRPKSRGQLVCSGCGGTSMRENKDFAEAVSSQAIRIQDIGGGKAIPETIEVLLEGELVGAFVPGDKVFATGVVVRRWKPLRPNEPMQSSLALQAICVTKEETDETGDIRHLTEAFSRLSTAGRRKLLMASFAAPIFGLAHVKLGILLSLASHCNSAHKESCRTNIHVLLVGDPGTGKTHLLKTAAKHVSPAVFTNGVGTSDAGLTSCAMRQGRDWSLEGGALVLADTGICCIDEFQRLNVGERSGLLEAMEQQTISVAKAGIVATLRTRCSVIAVANSKRRYDLAKPVSENLNLSTPLVSRFDLIFGLFDTKAPGPDKARAKLILERGCERKMPEATQWPLPALRIFISQCRKEKNVISEKLKHKLLKYYTEKRKAEGPNECNTLRMLEGLVRLAETHSRLMGQSEVEEDDAFIAIILMELSVGIPSLLNIDVDKVFVDEECFQMTKREIERAYLLS